MTTTCTECYKTAESINDKYYSVRTTSTGKDFATGLNDEILCLECLNEYIVEHGCGNIQSILRIENPEVD